MSLQIPTLLKYLSKIIKIICFPSYLVQLTVSMRSPAHPIVECNRNEAVGNLVVFTGQVEFILPN